LHLPGRIHLLLTAALAVARPALGDAPASTAGGHRASPRAIAHYLRARLAERAGDGAAALEERRRALEYDERSPQLRMDYAEALGRTGDLDRAEREARKALELAGQGAAAADAHLVLGSILAQGRRPASAVPELEAAIRIESALARARLMGGDSAIETEAWNLLSLIRLREGRDAEALATWDSLAALDPSQAAAGMRWSALQLLELGAADRAGPLLRRALELAPEDADGWRLVARMEDARGRAPEAQRAWEKTLALEPDDLEALQSLARLAVRARDLDAARARLDELTAADPDEVDVRVRAAGMWLDLHRPGEALEALAGGAGDARLDFLRGLALRALRRWKEAAAAFDRVGPESDVYSASRANLAYALSRAGEHEAAVRTAERAVAAVPGDVRLLTMLGHVLGRAGRAREAARRLREAIAAAERGRQQGLAELYDALAKALEQAGDRAQALSELRLAVKSHPGDEALLYALGAAQERAGQREAAIGQMRAILAANPRNAEAANFLGYSYAERGERLDEALALVKRALELDPENGYYLDSLGWVLFKKGDADRAVSALERAEAMAGPEATILEHLGDAYRLARRTGDAAVAYRRALGAFDPEDEEEETDPARRASLERKLRDLDAREHAPAAAR
jgi:tetratricopeptide (TPR) repeat protein